MQRLLTKLPTSPAHQLTRAYAAAASSGGGQKTGKPDPIEVALHKHEAKRKDIAEVIGHPKHPHPIPVDLDPHKSEAADINGVPEIGRQRTVRIFKPAREATQSGWKHVDRWKLDLDARERWDEHFTMGWSATGDPLSNISGSLEFATKEAAIDYCIKNRWAYEVDAPHERTIHPKAYGTIFHWSKRTRVSTK
ncbi:CBN-LPD-5 protein [Aphelenchoides avenae]|nr:CBN-LPD-5 protein [Aphelenchus avenae]